MAVFGPQLIYTIILFVILAKLGRFYSLGRYLLCHKLFRYLSPSSDELKKAVRTHYKNANSKNKKLNKMFDIDDAKDEFNIPEGLELELTMNPVLATDLPHIKYSDEFQSFVDISLIGMLIYTTTELYAGFFPTHALNEVNLSMVWCAAIGVYGVSALATIAMNYLRSSGAEASLMFIFASLSFVLSLVLQLGDGKFFDFQLKDAFRNATTTTYELIDQITASLINEQPANSTQQALYSQLKHYTTNELLFTCFIATCSAFIGGILFFPSFRLARLHFLAIKYSQESKWRMFLFYVNFLLPLLVSLCWFRPNLTSKRLSALNKTEQAMLEQEDNTTTTLNQFLSYISSSSSDSASSSMSNMYAQHAYAILTAANVKIYLILFLFVLRLTLYRHYAQGYLNLAYEVALSMRRRGAARITNLKYMSTISSIYQYYGVVASQYVMPVYVLLFLALLLKTLGDFSWCIVGANKEDIFYCTYVVESVSNYTSSMLRSSSSSQSSTLGSGVLKRFEEASNLNVTLGHNAFNKIFTPLVLRSVLGYFTFWTSTIWFGISCFGLLYYQYIDRVLTTSE